jgi:hypothetical protein
MQLTVILSEVAWINSFPWVFVWRLTLDRNWFDFYLLVLLFVGPKTFVVLKVDVSTADLDSFSKYLDFVWLLSDLVLLRLVSIEWVCITSTDVIIDLGIFAAKIILDIGDFDIVWSVSDCFW